MTEHEVAPPAPAPAAAPPRSINPLRWLLDLFTSVRFGIVLMVLIFIYCTVGSAGILYPSFADGFAVKHDFIRKWRPFEMTEYEWFNTPVFIALVALLCLNMSVVTVRRIRLNAVNLGVWLIHLGIIILALSSVWYFAAKVEGDTPVFRWRIQVEIPGQQPQQFAALSGSGGEFRTPEGNYSFRVAMMDPNWPIISPGFEGKTAFAITVVCTTPTGTFFRQLLDGYPQLTQDLVPSAEGPKRVKTLPEFEGRVLFDENIKLSLVPDPQQYFWVKDSAVMYVREVVNNVPGRWHQRPLPGLPRYNDYIDNPREIWIPEELMGKWRAQRLLLETKKADEADPLTNATARITAHLRYAHMQSQFVPGTSPDARNPVVNFTLATEGNPERPVQLVASDPEQRTALQGNIELRTVGSLDEIRDLSARESQRLIVHIPESGDTLELNLDDLNTQTTPPDFVAVGDTGYAVRFRQVINHEPDIGALIDIRTPDRVFSRWVPMLASGVIGETQDFVLEPGADMPRKVEPSPEINTLFDPGIPALTLVAGPADVGLRAIGRLIDLPDGLPLHSGASVKIQDALTLTVQRYMPDARVESKPIIVPFERRDNNTDEARAATMLRVEIQDAATTHTQWLTFDRYILDDETQQRLVSGTPPARFTLSDGRVFDIAIARRRMDLPAPVILEDFELLTHVGGFSGSAASVRDWVSHVAFQRDGEFSEKRTVAVNNPKPFGGYWYFQSFWDAPNQQRQTTGLTFTGLGVGNRHGVVLQLVGSAISVAGMIYAFYFKPIIKRRRADKVRAAVARGDFGDKARQRLQAAPQGAES